MISSQKTIAGTPKTVMAILAPKICDNQPHMNVDAIAAMLFTDPTQDNCSIVNGPVLRYVSFERSTGSAGERKPILLP